MDASKTCIITGISGQDGAYLSRLLLSKGCRVIGLTRGTMLDRNSGCLQLGIADAIKLVDCDLMDISQIIAILRRYQPDEIYNLAAQSSVSASFAQPIGTFQFNTLSVFNLLESIRIVDTRIKLYQASSSEMFGEIDRLPISEGHTFNPRSPYAVSKASAHWACVNYRDSYGMFVVCGILFNHESPLRNENFFVKKVVSGALRIQAGSLHQLEVGNIDLSRDFGYAPEYVEAMYQMMQMERPENLLICSGRSVSLRSIIEYVFQKLGIPHDRLVTNPALFRPSDIEEIYGSPERARQVLDWEAKTDIRGIVDILIDDERLRLEASEVRAPATGSTVASRVR